MSPEIAPSAPVSAESIADWHHEADVVIVGYGGAGACAAIEAARAGASVLLLERAGGGGGTTAMSAGHLYLGGGTRVQQRAHAIQALRPHSQVQRSEARVLVGRLLQEVEVRPRLEQQRGQLHVALAACNVKRTVATPMDAIGIRLLVEDEIDHSLQRSVRHRLRELRPLHLHAVDAIGPRGLLNQQQLSKRTIRGDEGRGPMRVWRCASDGGVRTSPE